MKDRGFLPEAVLLCATEQLLILPLTLTVLILAGARNIMMCFAAIFAMSCAIIAAHLFVPKKLQPYAKASVFLLLGAILAAICGFTIGSAFAFSFGVFFIIRANWIIKHRNNGFSFYIFAALGIVFYLLAAVVYGRSSMFVSYSPFLIAASTLAIIGSCLCGGITHIGYERRVINKISKVPRMTRVSNTFLISIFTILILVVAALGFVDQLAVLLGHVWDFIRNIISAIRKWFETLFMTGPSQPQIEDIVPGETELDNPDAVPETAFTRFIRTGGYYAVLALISLVLAYLLYMLLKKSKKFFLFILRKLSDYFKQFMAGQGFEIVDGGYEDEVTSLLKEGESGLDAARRWLASNRKPYRPYSLLRTNSERIRWLYKHSLRRALRKGIGIRATMTSKEALKAMAPSGNIPEETISAASEAYNTARYGSAEPDDAAVKAMRGVYSPNSPRV
jgi:hypothetical protein